MSMNQQAETGTIQSRTDESKSHPLNTDNLIATHAAERVPVLRLRLGTEHCKCTFCPWTGECEVYQLWLDYDPDSERSCHLFAEYSLCHPRNPCSTLLYEVMCGMSIPFYRFCCIGLTQMLLPEGSPDAERQPSCIPGGPCTCLRVSKPTF